MQRDEKLSTTVTEREKQAFRELAAIDGLTMSGKLRELVYDELEERDRKTTRDEGNQTGMTPETAD
jgi:hypothetical protein